MNRSKGFLVVITRLSPRIRRFNQAALSSQAEPKSAGGSSTCPRASPATTPSAACSPPSTPTPSRPASRPGPGRWPRNWWGCWRSTARPCVGALTGPGTSRRYTWSARGPTTVCSAAIEHGAGRPRRSAGSAGAADGERRAGEERLRAGCHGRGGVAGSSATAVFPRRSTAS